MFRVCNCLFIILNIFSLLFSLVCIIYLLHFHINGASDCQRILKTPLMVVGILFSVVSLVGLIGTLCKVTFLLGIYSFIAFLWIVGLIAFTFLVLLVTKDGDYSRWMKGQFANGRNWNNIQSCMVYTHACSSLDTNADLLAQDFYKKKLLPMESGCCKPPVYCGFEFKNATFWVMPESGPEVPDSDCTTWSNEQDKLCYGCKSCKVGVVAGIRSQWRAFSELMCVQIVLVNIIYCISCCTRKNIQSDNSVYYRVKNILICC